MMSDIPKILHYCWFGGKEKPPDVCRRIKTWHEVLPDFEIKEWNESNYDVQALAYTREAYAMGDYAFVADVARLDALVKYGGIYLDTDVDIIRPLNSLMADKSFVGLEGERIGTAVIGSVPGSMWLEIFLSYYDNRHYLNAFGHPVRTPNTRVLTEMIMPRIQEDERPRLYPTEVLCAKDYRTQHTCITSATLCVHNFNATWRRHRSALQKVGIILRGIKVRYF